MVSSYVFNMLMKMNECFNKITLGILIFVNGALTRYQNSEIEIYCILKAFFSIETVLSLTPQAQFSRANENMKCIYVSTSCMHLHQNTFLKGKEKKHYGTESLYSP